MESDHSSGKPGLYAGWIAGAVAAAAASGWCVAAGHGWAAAVAAAVALGCGFRAAIETIRLNRKIDYIMEASINNDFSYKFSTESVSADQREINLRLNRMVEHLEKLTGDARQNEAFLTWAINLMDVGIVVADAGGDVRVHNQAALRLLDRPVLTCLGQISLSDNSGLAVSRSSMTLNGSNFSVLTISDLRRPVQAAEVESWEKFTRVLTHEIMNSLTPIQSIAETMMAKASDKDSSEAFAAISSSSRSLMLFVNKFRQLNVLPEPRMEAMYVKPFLEKCARLAESYVEGSGARITVTCFRPDMMAYTDGALLSQVVLNIVKNAAEAAPSVIAIEADVKADESVEIRIANDGELIADDIARQIFTPFFTTRPTGSGIGLSLSRRIVMHLGGTLTLINRPHTCFVVRL